MIEYCQTMLIYLCVGVFGCLALVWLAMFVHAQTRRFVACFRRGGRFNAALALIAVGAMVVPLARWWCMAVQNLLRQLQVQIPRIQ